MIKMIGRAFSPRILLSLKVLGWDGSRRWRYSPFSRFSRISRLKFYPLGGLGVLAVQHQQGGLVLAPAEPWNFRTPEL